MNASLESSLFFGTKIMHCICMTHLKEKNQIKIHLERWLLFMQRSMDASKLESTRVFYPWRLIKSREVRLASKEYRTPKGASMWRKKNPTSFLPVKREDVFIFEYLIYCLEKNNIVRARERERRGYPRTEKQGSVKSIIDRIELHSGRIPGYCQKNDQMSNTFRSVRQNKFRSSVKFGVSIDYSFSIEFLRQTPGYYLGKINTGHDGHTFFYCIDDCERESVYPFVIEGVGEGSCKIKNIYILTKLLISPSRMLI